jgi:predicted RNA-binding protein (virulence factor B family)
MDRKLLQRVTSEIPLDVSDELEVFLYTNIDKIASSNQSVLLTPAFQAALLIALNDVGSRHNVGLSKDLKDVLDVFIIANVNVVVADTTP